MKGTKQSLQVAVNPAWLSAAEHLELLNRCFHGQWDRAAYNWYLHRPFQGRSPDVLAIAQGGRVISSMGMAYRQLRIGEEAPIDVAVILAAATRRDMRDQGHYARLLQLAREQSRLRGCAAILAFVTRENASGRGLMRMGSIAIPSYYLMAGDSSVTSPCARHMPRELVSPARPLSLSIRTLLEDVRMPHDAVSTSGSQRCVRFFYERAEDWGSQFISRPQGADLRRPDGCALALTETVRCTQRLQWLGGRAVHVERCVRVLIAVCRRHTRGFFMYSVDAGEARAAQRAGCRVRAGYLMLQPTGRYSAAWTSLAAAPAWSVQSGDRL
jgi:hypothetical protein